MPRLNADQRKVVDLFNSSPSYMRAPVARRQKKETHETYKKGWEIRFTASSKSDAAVIGRLLKSSGLAAGKPYKKSAKRWILPVYGRDASETFAGWLK